MKKNFVLFLLLLSVFFVAVISFVTKLPPVLIFAGDAIAASVILYRTASAEQRAEWKNSVLKKFLKKTVPSEWGLFYYSKQLS